MENEMENEAIKKFYEVCKTTYPISFLNVEGRVKTVPWGNGFKIYVNGVWFVTVDDWEANIYDRLFAYAYCTMRLANTDEFRAI